MQAVSIIAVLLANGLFANAAPAGTNLFVRSTSCGGNTALSPCGGSYPSDFCCPSDSICLPLNTTGAVATVCCPSGVDCRTILPTTCNQGAYNATLTAGNQIHVAPITALSTCGSACCPAGYSCQDSQRCVAISNAANSTIPTSTATATATTSVATASSTSADDDTTTTMVQASNQSSFSGSSFAAGFVPGILLGVLLLAAVLWLLRRRRRGSFDTEKAHSQDRLTPLSPATDPQRPVGHMRSISEPAMVGPLHRTDFLRNSPGDETEQSSSFETIDEERSSASDQYNDRRPMYQFEASPVPSQSPIPTHMKRGTLSYSISPIRQLRTKKSVSSLRRHATDASQRARLSIARSNTSASTVTTGTIQVAMTPDQRPSYIGPSAHHDVSPISDTQQPWTTPTRQPVKPQPGMLGSPYSYRPRDPPSTDYLDPNIHTRNKRVTTFSSLMEKAGLRKEDFLPRER